MSDLHKELPHPSACPGCGANLGMATPVGHNDSPDPGDVTACFHCGVVLTFTDDLGVREVTPEELDAYSQTFRRLLDKMEDARQGILARLCECGHPLSDHDFALTSCKDDDCTCRSYEWDGDEGGAAVTRSRAP